MSPSPGSGSASSLHLSAALSSPPDGSLLLSSTPQRFILVPRPPCHPPSPSRPRHLSFPALLQSSTLSYTRQPRSSSVCTEITNSSAAQPDDRPTDRTVGPDCLDQAGGTTRRLDIFMLRRAASDLVTDATCSCNRPRGATHIRSAKSLGQLRSRVAPFFSGRVRPSLHLTKFVHETGV